MNPAEHEALARLARVHGAQELQAAVLALISPADNSASFIAWSQETQFTPSAPLLRGNVTELTDATRLPCLEALLERMRQRPKPERRVLLQSTRRLMAAIRPLRPLDRLHWLFMRRRLGDRAPQAAQPEAENSFDDLSGVTMLQIARVAAYLAKLVPGADRQAGEAWYRASMSQLMPPDLVPPCTAPDGDGLAHALDEVESLPWMLRPVLLRGWVDAALATSARARLPHEAADALRLAAGLLDSPLPPELARHYIELDWEH